MSQHVPADLLHAFVEGELTDDQAVTVAVHLDGCPSCAARAASLEPLTPFFAAVSDPEPPPDLVPAILARAQRPDWLPGWEVIVGSALLATAALLAFAVDSPLALATDAVVVVNATGALMRGVAGAVGSFHTTMSLVAGLALAGAVLTLHLSGENTALDPRRTP
ncbi:MAG: zf-HC2 domain-containing protein [Myxococcota bacterium]